MAISLKPRLLLLDEPTAGMSPDETYATGEMVRALNAEGITVLAVEHDMTFVRQIAQPRDGAALRPDIRARARSTRSRPTTRVAEIYFGHVDHEH